MNRRWKIAVLACAGSSGLLLAQPRAGQYSQADVEYGFSLYNVHCIACHGASGDSVPGVDLRSGRFRRASSDSDLNRLIQTGIPGTAMPPGAFTSTDLGGLVAYVRSMHDFDAGQAVRGDAARGRAVFESKGACASCHSVNGNGSRVGPDLSEIGSVRSPEALARSLIDPSASMLPLNRYVRAVTRQGKQIRGRRLNEDTYSVQLIDTEERLVSLLKADLAEYTVEKTSAMPSYKDTLSAGERDDLVAYLRTLKGFTQSPRQPLAHPAQVSYERLLRAADEPQNWLSYSGGYASLRYSSLRQIEPGNVSRLEQQWAFQAESLEKFEATPLVVDGIMYLTQAPSDAVALDAKTGRVFWIYRHHPSTDVRPCCGSVNHGLAILGDTLFLAALDAELVALDAKSGRPLWKTKVADPKAGYAMTLAPLVVKDKVLVGVAGGEYGIRGFVAAYDAKTGREAWRFYTVPGPGEPGHETWQGDSWEHGGGPIWLTGSYDPELNLTYWGTGNPGPDWNPEQRPGDNLYSDSVLALDPDTGKLKWHFQFTPNDPYDYDAAQIPVLVDAPWNGSPRKLMLWANRNGFFYVLDRATGQFLAGHPFVKLNWASGLDAKGRPIQTPQPNGAPTYPGIQGGTNWYSPSYSPRTGLFYVSAWEDYGHVLLREPQKFEPGRRFVGGRPTSAIPGAQGVPGLRRGHVNVWTEAAGHGAVIALDPKTGQPKWKFPMTDVTDSGILTTATDLLFTGGREGYFHALDARTGALLWKASLGSQIASGPMTYQVDGRQYVAVAAGHALFTFALRRD